jgi:ribosomal protein S9
VTTPNQLSSGILATHSEEIKNIQATIKGLDDKLKQHDKLLRDVRSAERKQVVAR